jgi:hypothetical protein
MVKDCARARARMKIINALKPRLLSLINHHNSAQLEKVFSIICAKVKLKKLRCRRTGQPSKTTDKRIARLRIPAGLPPIRRLDAPPSLCLKTLYCGNTPPFVLFLVLTPNTC